MAADYFQLFHVFGSGADTEAFHLIALSNQMTQSWRSLTNYTYFLTYVYSITESSRLIAQYINVLFGLGTIVFVERLLSLLYIDKKIKKIAVLFVVLLPNLIIFSGILLREAWITFFISASLFYFIRWFINGSNSDIILSISMVLLATLMHSGVIGILAGYCIAFLIYNPTNQKVQFSMGSIISLLLLVGGIVIFLNYSNLFTSKFASYDIDNPDAFVELTNRKSRGGSAYLSWINVDNMALSFLFAPLIMFYFLFSPLPTEWRGFADILGFCIDGAAYLWLCVAIFRSKRLPVTGESLRKFLLISILFTVFIFAFGVRNAGTAMRHRAKFVPLIIVTYAVSVGYKKNKSLILKQRSLENFAQAKK